MSDDTPWDRDVRTVLSAMIRQTPMAQLPNMMPSMISAAVEIADKIAEKRNAMTVGATR